MKYLWQGEVVNQPCTKKQKYKRGHDDCLKANFMCLVDVFYVFRGQVPNKICCEEKDGSK